MTTSPQVEYVGFKTEGASREYALRVREAGGEPRDITVAIPNEAFLSRRVRYQDAPEICFLKLQRELGACPAGAFPAAYLNVTDSDLEEYRVARIPKAPQRRPKIPPVTT
jgi:hypothetical protein